MSLRIIVFGSGNSKLREVVNEMEMQNPKAKHYFEYVEEVKSLEKEFNKVFINFKYCVTDFNGVLLNSTDSVYNFIWAESQNTNWIASPFLIRNASNNNFQSALASTSGFKVSESIPHFHNRKVTVTRHYPEGDIFRVFYCYGEIFLFSNSPYQRKLVRACQKFMKRANLNIGVFEVIKEDITEDLILKEFSSVIDWDILPKTLIRTFLTKYLWHLSIISKGYLR